MRRLRALFQRLCDPDELAVALELTVRGKRRRSDVAWLLFRREDVLELLAAELTAGTWRPRRFRQLLLRDPKPRVIARSSIEDRVVHTAIARLLEPAILRRTVDGDFACRVGGGTQRAQLRLLELSRRHEHVVHLDFRSYFASIDLEILRTQLVRMVADRQFLGVVDRLLESGRGLQDSALARRHARMDSDWPPPGRGLPMGAVTSQLFAAHLYPNPLDHFIKRELKVPGYVRYVDDLFLFGDRRADLGTWRDSVGEFAADRLHLRLKRANAPVLACRGVLHALGVRVSREGLRPLPRAFRRLKRRAGAAGRGERSLEEFERSVQGVMGTLWFG